MSQPHLLYISGTVPCQGYGGFIVFYRHLQRLEQSNWKVSVATAEQFLAANEFPISWQILPIPTRRWWWPPYRKQQRGALALRMRLWRREIEHLVKGERPTAILTNLFDIYAVLAAFIAKAWNVPLVVVVHDDWELFSGSEDERRLIKQYKKIVLDQASMVLPVSRRLGDTLGLNGSRKLQVMLPIPAGNTAKFIEWNDRFQKRPVVAYAGKIYPGLEKTLQIVADCLKSVDGALLLVADSSDGTRERLTTVCSNIIYQARFNENSKAINFLAENSSCILVTYPFDVSREDSKWKMLSSSFPSKFIEFSHLGMPVLLLAPPNTALADWAEDHRWLAWSDSTDQERLIQLLQGIADSSSWIKMAEQSRRVARNEFNPDVIQQQFERALLSSNASGR